MALSSNHAHRPSIPQRLAYNAATSISRRDWIGGGILASSFIISSPALADDQMNGDSGMVSVNTVRDLLRAVPTFTIVDKKGVPFMVVGEDAKVTGYFFTSYDEASRILKLASSSADKAIAEAKAEGKTKEEVGENPWKKARISSVPLDSAVTLVSKSAASFGGGNYFRIAVSEGDIDDALALSGQEDLAEGKVPLFYFADFTIDVDGEKRSPLYFRKAELVEKFRATNPKTELPRVLVTELFAVLTEMVRPGNTDAELKSLYFVPQKDSEKKRKQCEKAGGQEPPFFIGQRIIVL